jgi:hypothetical protein
VTRRILRKLIIDEISIVDRPAQEHARALIMKRHDDNGETKMTDNVDIQKVAHFGIECAAAELRKREPNLTPEQAFAKAYQDPANRLLAEAEREAAYRKMGFS